MAIMSLYISRCGDVSGNIPKYFTMSVPVTKGSCLSASTCRFTKRSIRSR
jgi:hypothetical protein